MQDTWASGPLELLAHAQSHLDYASPFNRRIAFVSVDNAVELSLRTYLTLPRRYFTDTKPPAALDEDADFSELLEAVFAHARERLSGFRRTEISKYHDLRNLIYHRSVGTDVDQRFLDAYFGLAALLIHALFGAQLSSDSPALAGFRRDILDVLEAEWRASRRRIHSGRVTTGMQLLKKKGRTFGRPLKDVTPAELTLAKRLNRELGWGSTSIARFINERRGVGRLASAEARRNASITHLIVEQRLRADGGYLHARAKWAGRREIPEGFE